MPRARLLALIGLALAACTAVAIPKGPYACDDAGDDCASGFACVGGICVGSGAATTAASTGATTTTSGGTAGTTAGTSTTGPSTSGATTSGAHGTTAGATSGTTASATGGTTAGATSGTTSGGSSGNSIGGSPGVACEISYAAAVLADQPALYYHFDEPVGATTVIDSSGHGLNGTYTDRLILGVPGEEGTAVAFGADGGYALYTPATALTGSFTVELWANPADCSDGAILSTRQPDEESFDIETNGGGQCGEGIHGDLGTGDSGWLDTSMNSTVPLTLNQWNHIVYVVTASNYSIYQNGQRTVNAAPYNQGSGLPELWDPTHVLQVGAYANIHQAYFFNGAVDELAIYPTALTADRIAAHYAQATQCVSEALAPTQILNLDYGNGGAELYSGPAAIGAGPNDVWNPIYQANGTDFTVGPLLWADGTASPVSVESINLPGAWTFTPENGNLMLGSMSYNMTGSTAQIELTGLPSGAYALYLYGEDRIPTNLDPSTNNYINSGYAVNVYDGSHTLLDGLSPLFPAPTGDSPAWVDGLQYVVQGNVCVAAGDTVEVAISAGGEASWMQPDCIIDGLQILQTAAGDCTQIDAGTSLTNLFRGASYATAIALDPSNVYWVDYNDQTLFRMAKGGGTPVTLASGLSGAGGGLAVDSQFAYWTESTAGTVRKVSIDGGTPVTLAQGQTSAEGLAIDDLNVYWTNRVASGTVMRASKLDGSNPLTLFTGDSNTLPLEVVVDGQQLYWTSNNTPSGVLGFGSLNSVPTDGGANVVLTSSGVPTGVTFDANNIYWTDYGAWTCCNFSALDGLGLIWKLAKGGSTPVLIASGQSQPSSISVDSETAYWTNYRNGTAASVSLDGGIATVFDNWGFCCGNTAIDSTGMYFATCNTIDVLANP